MTSNNGVSLGFIGLGTMGEPMCRNLAAKAGRPVLAYDLRSEPGERLAARGVAATSSIAAIAVAETIFLSLPGRDEVRAVCLGPGGLLDHVRRGQSVVDLSTTPAGFAREIAAACAAIGVAFADAPVARTRAAAESGTLSIMVGADQATFSRIAPLLACMAEEITHCGPVGAGQTVKLMNNMVLFQTVVALAEALAVGRRAGIDPATLFATMAKGSADSFALRHHGMKAMLPDKFPDNAFSTAYALKDLSYALEMAEAAGVDTAGARLAREILERSAAAGNEDAYFPSLVRVLDQTDR
jgi:hypothetical protein